MKWFRNLLDLIIQKEDNSKKDEWEPIPLRIEDEFYIEEDLEPEEEKNNKVIIIDI